NTGRRVFAVNQDGHIMPVDPDGPPRPPSRYPAPTAPKPSTNVSVSVTSRIPTAPAAPVVPAEGTPSPPPARSSGVNNPRLAGAVGSVVSFATWFTRGYGELGQQLNAGGIRAASAGVGVAADAGATGLGLVSLLASKNPWIGTAALALSVIGGAGEAEAHASEGHRNKAEQSVASRAGGMGLGYAA